MTLKHAKTFFPETLSPCCSATVHKGVCCDCGKVCKLPFYFLTTTPVTDEQLIAEEVKLRSALPVGAELVARLFPKPL